MNSIAVNSLNIATPIMLNSKYATHYINNSNSNCVFSLPYAILRPDNKQMIITLNNMTIPHSYYNINSYNNTLIYTMNSITYTLTITINNYNINDLVLYLNTNLSSNGFTLTYSGNTNKLTIVNSTYDFSISSSSTCLVLLGLSSSLSSTAQSLTSDIVCDLSYTKSLYVNINLNLNCLDSRNGMNLNSILAQIPVEQNYLGIEVYKNFYNNSHLLFETKISNIQIFITDDNDNIINLNSIHWDAYITIDYVFNDKLVSRMTDDMIMNKN